MQSTFCFEGEGEGGLGNYKKNILAQEKLLKKTIVQREPRVKIEQVLSTTQVLFFFFHVKKTLAKSHAQPEGQKTENFMPKNITIQSTIQYKVY